MGAFAAKGQAPHVTANPATRNAQFRRARNSRESNQALPCAGDDFREPLCHSTWLTVDKAALVAETVNTIQASPSRLAPKHLFGCRGNGCQIHREHYTSLWELIDSDYCACRPMLSHLFNVGSVHLFKIHHALKEHVDVYDVIEIRTDRLKHDLEGIKNLFGLEIGVRSSELTGFWIHAGRSADGNEFTNLRNMAVRADWSRGVRRNRCFDSSHS